MNTIKKHIDLLGHKATDKITGFTGVITSISFDLYGCIQAVITPQADSEKGEYKSGNWFDEILESQPKYIPFLHGGSAMIDNHAINYFEEVQKELEKI